MKYLLFEILLLVEFYVVGLTAVLVKQWICIVIIIELIRIFSLYKRGCIWIQTTNVTRWHFEMVVIGLFRTTSFDCVSSAKNSSFSPRHLKHVPSVDFFVVVKIFKYATKDANQVTFNIFSKTHNEINVFMWKHPDL